MRDLYFEELVSGMEFSTGGVTITEDAVIRFGLEWDFQPFHVDREKAKNSIFGELIASGLHTLVLTFRLCNQHGLFTGHALAGIAYENVRFLRPVSVGSTISAHVTVGERRLSRSRPDTGIVKWHIRTLNERDDVVMTTDLVNLIARRPESEV